MDELSHLYVDLPMLRKNYACKPQQELFAQVFGRKGRFYFTKANWDKAVRAGLNVGWLSARVARKLRNSEALSMSQYCRYFDGSRSYASTVKLIRQAMKNGYRFG